MSLTHETTPLPGVLIFQPDTFIDSRGRFMEVFRVAGYRAAGVDCSFVQDNYSHSVRDVLRGLHYQLRTPQQKLVSVLRGRIFDVVADIRLDSPTRGRWFGVELSGENRKQIFVPAGFAHGFCVLSDEADVLYKCSAYYDPADDRGIHWSDPTLGIDWPVRAPLLSPKDAALPWLADIPDGERPKHIPTTV